jgi:TRAP-type transport system small permease protein
MRQLDDLLTLLAGVALMSMMFLTAVDVVGRYFFARSVPGAFELTELMLVVIIFLALPSLSYSGGQIETDLFESAMPPALWRGLYRAARLLAAFCLAYVAWKSWTKAGNMKITDTTSALGIALLPFAYLITIMTALAALVELYRWLIPLTPADSEGQDLNHQQDLL